MFSLQRSTKYVSIVPKSEIYDRVIIHLHGLGDNGLNWAEGLLYTVGRDSRFATTKFICPTAPHKPITFAGGAEMPAWYDIVHQIGTGKLDLLEENAPGIEVSESYVQKLIDEMSDEVGSKNVVLSGFSQGGATSLFTTLRLKKKIGACICISGYLPRPVVQSEESKSIPILMLHGVDDPVVPHLAAEKSLHYIQETLNHSLVELKSFRGVEHAAPPEVMKYYADWLSNVFQKPNSN